LRYARPLPSLLEDLVAVWLERLQRVEQAHGTDIPRARLVRQRSLKGAVFKQVRVGKSLVGDEPGAQGPVCPVSPGYLVEDVVGYLAGRHRQVQVLGLVGLNLVDLVEEPCRVGHNVAKDSRHVGQDGADIVFLQPGSAVGLVEEENGAFAARRLGRSRKEENGMEYQMGRAKVLGETDMADFFVHDGAALGRVMNRETAAAADPGREGHGDVGRVLGIASKQC